jgi:hypothetical protein
MVRQGDFIVEMVEAESKTPFKEHRRTSDGKVFVEVEPDIEYFVRIEKVGHNPTNNQHEYNGGAASVVSATIRVDGQNMGARYSWNREDRYFVYAGLLRREGRVDTETALKVFKPLQKQRVNGGSPTQGSSYVTGKVQVKIRERISTGTYYDEAQRQTQSTSKNFKTCSTIEYSGEKEKKKLLRSKVGCTVVVQEESSSPPGTKRLRYNRGEILDTITLQYCSAVGLIEVGVLPRPASWGKIKQPHQSSPTLKRAFVGTTATTVTPPPAGVATPLLKKIRVETIVTTQESTFIDLSEVPSDDEEEGDHRAPKSLF